MAKKSSGVGVKQLLLQKGERYGFFAAAALLLFFLAFGVYVAASSASSSKLADGIASNIKSAQDKLKAESGAEPQAIDVEVWKDPKKLDIKFTSMACGSAPLSAFSLSC